MTYAAFLATAPAATAMLQSSHKLPATQPVFDAATKALNFALAPTSPDAAMVVEASHSLMVSSAATTSTVYTFVATTHTTATTAAESAAQEFGPVLPDTGALLGILAIVLASAVATWVWANQVVPVSRTKLALSKRDGNIKEYLEELESLQQPPAETMESMDDSEVSGGGGGGGATSMGETSNKQNNNRKFEQWLFTDWLEQKKEKDSAAGSSGSSSNNRKPGRQKEPALPILKSANWNSGDNPVLAATALIMVGVILASITEQLSAMLS